MWEREGVLWVEHDYLQAMHASPPTTFACQACGERLVVDAAVREALLEHGCVFCGAAVEPAAFDRE